MPIIVDTSAILSVILNESTKSEIIKATEGQELLAPKSLRWEIGNAFSAMFKRNRITLDKAMKGFQIFKKIPIRYPDTDINTALTIAHKNNIYAYDAYFISMAITQHCPFITLDNSLKILASNIGIEIIKVNHDNI